METEAPLPRVILAQAFHEALLITGVVRRGDRVRRVVIDANHGDAVRVYVERWGDERLLKVVPTLEGVEITTEPEAAHVGPDELDDPATPITPGAGWADGASK